MLLTLLRAGQDTGRELAAFRFLARSSTDAEVLALCRAVARGEELPAGLHPGRPDRFLAAAALLAARADDADAVLQALEQQLSSEGIGKESFQCRAAIPTAANKAAYWEHYLQLQAPPEQWTQDSLSFFHWPGQDLLTLPYLRQSLEKVDWVKQNRRIFFMPAWLDAFVNGHSSADALAIVDDFLAKAELSYDVRNKLLQSRDGLARTVRIRAVFGDGK
jgi:aminopeptidase N